MKRSYLAVILSPLGLLCLSPVVVRAATIEVPGVNLTAQNQSPSSPAPPGGPGVESPTAPPGGPGVESPAPTSSEDLVKRTQEAGKQQEEKFQQRRAAAEAAENQRRAERQAAYDQEIQQYQDNKIAREKAEAESRKIAQEKARRQARAVAKTAPISDYPDVSKTVVQVPVTPSPETTQPPKAETKLVAKKLKLGKLSFSCSADSKTPTTIARIKDKNLDIILWVSDLFASKGFDPKTRCQQVTARLEEYNKKQTLAYLTTGKLNGQSVICVTSKADGNCGDGIPVYEGLLFTLRPDSNSQNTLEQLADALQDEKGKEKPLEE